MAYLIQPVEIEGQKYCFTDGDNAHLGRSWRTSAAYPNITGYPNLASETSTDVFDIVPNFTGPASGKGEIKFALACNVSAIDITVTHDRDSANDEAEIRVYLNGAQVAASVSQLGTTGQAGDEHDWKLAGGSSFVLSVNNLTSSPCGSILRITAFMENSGAGDTYIEAAITSVTA